jgi:hypothetical protein
VNYSRTTTSPFYLLFSRDGDLVAQKFDLSRLQMGESVIPIVRNIQYDTFFHDGMFSVSANGTLVYGTAGSGVNTQLAWMDRNGRVLGSLGEPGQFERQSILADGTRVVVGVKFGNAREGIWIYDVERGTRIPIVNSESPDGKRAAYRSTLGKTSTLVAHNSDGSGVERGPGSIHFELLNPTDWSPEAVKTGSIGFVSWELMEQGNRCWTSTMQVPEGSHQTGVGSPTSMKIVGKCMSLPFRDLVPESRSLPRVEAIPDGEETGRNSFMSRMT